MLKKRSMKAERRRAKLEGQVLAGLIDAGMLMACADGQITEQELDVVANVIGNYCEGDVTLRAIRELIDLSYAALESEGYDARLEVLADNLPEDDDIREAALSVAAAVMLCDDEEVGESDDENETYLAIAEALEISEERAEEIFNDTADAFES